MNAIGKLKLDAARYRKDCNITSNWKLILINEFWPVFLLRLEEYVDSGSAPKIWKFFLHIITVLIKPLIKGLSGTRITRGAKIGGGLLLHGSVGIVIASESVVGENCTICPGVGILHKANDKGEGAPIIGDNVILTNGCKIIGNIRIGSNVLIGTNSVVSIDVPDNSTAVGIPAHIIDRY